MYKLPEDFDLAILSDCYLDMVSFGPFMTQLHFTRPMKSIGQSYAVSFLVESELSYCLDGSSGHRDFLLPETGAPLIGALKKNVTELSKYGSESLKIDFGDYGFLIVDGDKNPGFEAYSIFLPSGDLLIV